MWAALIANAASGSAAAVPPALPSILQQLSPVDAALLAQLFAGNGFARAAGTDGNYPEPFNVAPLSLSRWEIDVSVSNLERLGVISVDVTGAWVQEIARQVVDEGFPSHDVAPKRDRRVVLTGLGESFLVGCLPPPKRPFEAETDGIETDVSALSSLHLQLHMRATAAHRRGDTALGEEIDAEKPRIKKLEDLAKEALKNRQ